MNIIIRFCIVKKFQKLETQLNLHAKQKFPKGSQFFCPKKKNYHTKSLIIGIILHSQKVCNNDLDNCLQLSSFFTCFKHAKPKSFKGHLMN
jgi:hypothetical protein